MLLRGPPCARVPGGFLVLSAAHLVLSPSLVSLLINFVVFYSLAAASLAAAYNYSTFVGLAYLLVYAGAVSVLFVFVVLLVENQHLSLAVPRSTEQLYPGLLALLYAGISLAGASCPRKLLSFFGLLSSEKLQRFSLCVLLYGETLPPLIFTGWVLLVATIGPVMLLCFRQVTMA